MGSTLRVSLLVECAGRFHFPFILRPARCRHRARSRQLGGVTRHPLTFLSIILNVFLCGVLIFLVFSSVLERCDAPLAHTRAPLRRGKRKPADGDAPVEAGGGLRRPAIATQRTR